MRVKAFCQGGSALPLLDIFSRLKYFWAPKNCGKDMKEVNDNNLKAFYKLSKINLWRFRKTPTAIFL